MNIYELNDVIKSLDEKKDKELLRFYKNQREELSHILAGKVMDILDKSKGKRNA